jgi:hypothetical protein
MRVPPGVWITQGSLDPFGPGAEMSATGGPNSKRLKIRGIRPNISAMPVNTAHYIRKKMLAFGGKMLTRVERRSSRAWVKFS